MILRSRAVRALKRVVFGPKIVIRRDVNTLRLGSSYGAWTFVDRPELHGGTILCCGLGEDATFDVEVAQRFGSTVVIVDPTPRAIDHFEAVTARMGKPSEMEYVSGGRQPIEAYDLSNVRLEQFHLVPKALAGKRGLVRFYAPADPTSVSHSIVNFQNGYSTSTPFIEVPAIDFPALVRDEGIGEIALVKFDIEGAEIMVIPQMIAARVFPEQVLVEFDELNWPSRRSRSNFDYVHNLLLENEYQPIFYDKRSCVSYLRVTV